MGPRARPWPSYPSETRTSVAVRFGPIPTQHACYLGVCRGEGMSISPWKKARPTCHLGKPANRGKSKNFKQ